MKAPEVLGWARLADNGARHHAVILLEPYLTETACGMVTHRHPLMRPDEDFTECADAPNPPKRCPRCIKALDPNRKAGR